MIAFVFWYQQALALGQTVAKDIPSLGTILTAFASICALFILRAVMAMRDKMQQVLFALYGVPDAKEPDGIVHDLREARGMLDGLTQKFTKHVDDEGRWQVALVDRQTLAADKAQETLTRLDTRLETVEERLSKRRTDR